MKKAIQWLALLFIGLWPTALDAATPQPSDTAVPDLPIAPPPATRDEVMCWASYFVVATVLPSTTTDAFPNLPLSLRVEQILAPPIDEKHLNPIRTVRKGEVLTVSVRMWNHTDIKVPKPTDYQGTIDVPDTMKGPEVAKSLIGNNFIFGLLPSHSSGANSQIWSMSLKKDITELRQKNHYPSCECLEGLTTCKLHF